MKTSSEISNNLYFLSGGGEMGELTRSFDWSKTPMGFPDQWPQSLRTTIGIILHSAFPMFLFWGEELTCFYNDAYRPSLGKQGKHPILGRKGKEAWPEIWDFISPLIDKVMTTGNPAWFEDQLLPIYRNGKMEDVYWTFSYSPVYGDKGEINGVFVTCVETTGKVQTVKKLVQSEKRFQTLIHEATVGIIVVMGEAKRIEIVNDAYCKLIGRKYDELFGKPLFDVIPEAEPYFSSIIDKVRETGDAHYLYEHPYFVFVNGIRKDGVLNLVYKPYREDDGTITGVMILCQDVEAQVLSHKKLEESEQRVRSLVESAPFPIGVYTGKEMRIALANKAITDAWGKGSEVIGKLYSEILPELDNQEIFSQLDGVYTTGIPFHARNKRVDIVIDGKLQPYYFNYSFTPLYDAKGKVYGVMNTAAEVTDLNLAKQKVEQSERNFRSMILQTPVAMCILLGPLHVVEVANEFMINLWGKRAADVMNKPIFEALPEAKEQGLEQLLADVYTTGEPFKANERPVALLRNDKMENVYQNFVYEPYKDADGTILGILAISIDVTEQVLARQKIEEVVAERTKQLEQANNSLQKSNAELAQFAYIASHDLQEPLRKISTFTQMLENRAGNNLDELSKNYLSKINNSSLRMNTLIRDVLNYSELVKDTEVFIAVDLNLIIEDVINDYELLIEQKQAIIQYEKLPVIEAIPLQMAQLFSNIIGNALKFSRKDVNPVITVTYSRLSNEEKRHFSLNQSLDYFKIKFSDNGIGFNAEYAVQIFNIFQRLHGKSEYEGNGIGLAMCKKIALNHQGELNAIGSSERGAVFNAILPAKHF